MIKVLFLLFVLAILYDVGQYYNTESRTVMAFCVTSEVDCLHLELVFCSQLLDEQHALSLKVLVQTPRKLLRTYHHQFMSCLDSVL